MRDSQLESQVVPQSPPEHFMAWVKVLMTWIAGGWATFSLQGFLQDVVLILTAIYTIVQIYIQWRDKIRSPK